MGHGTRLEMHGGRLVVVKWAAAGPAVTRLGHEAMCLRRSAHPGVVELVDVSGGDGDVTDGAVVLRTAFVGGGTLAERPPGGLGLTRTIQVAASLAATMADLHGQGITHGRVSADHVLTADGGGAVLCGFAEAALGDGSEAHRSAAAADVTAVGQLIRALAGDGRVPGAAGLLAVADRALADDPAARPSMRTLADALGELASGTGPGGGPGSAVQGQGRRLLPRKGPPRSFPWLRRRRPRLVLTAGLATLSVTVTAAVALGSPPRPTDGSALGAGGGAVPTDAHPPVRPPPTSAAPPVASTAPTTPPNTPPTAPATGGIVRVWPPSPCAVPLAETTADIDGDGCEEQIDVDGGVLSAGGRRWEVAGPGDVVLVGDWDCDDIATPAVVRPGSGQVWRFPRWAGGPGEAIVASLVTTVPGAVGATVGRATDLPPGCDHLVVLDTAGATTRIVPGEATDPQ